MNFKYRKVLHEMHDRFIEGSYKGDLVIIEREKLCSLTKHSSRCLGLEGMGTAFITTRALKHIYEQRTAAEYQLIKDKLFSLVKRPKAIYVNKPGKRGTYCFLGPLRKGDPDFICSVELVAPSEIEIATIFEYRDRYFRNCKLLGNWGDGITSHRIALDAGQVQSTNNPQ